MSFIFGGGGPSAPPPLPPLPTRADPAIAARRQAVKAAEAKRKGRRATLLTGGQGVAASDSLNRPTLLTDEQAPKTTLG